MRFSRSQIDRLGQRLRAGSPSEDDIRLLDEYRTSFDDALRTVVGRIRERVGLQPSSRPRKTTPSIIEKLNRETIRLSQMQDVAGCRIVVASLAAQDAVVADLLSVFPGSDVIDRRARPSHGYRAVHVIVDIDGKHIEVQVRTELQHLWAEICEGLSDRVDKGLKYGGGPEETLRGIERFSDWCYKIETDAPERRGALYLKEMLSALIKTTAD